MNYASLIKKLFEARQVIHNEHLATNSFSAHKALGKFYEEAKMGLPNMDKALELYKLSASQEYDIAQLKLNNWLQSILKWGKNILQLFLVIREIYFSVDTID